jgi:hypothetical protein
MPCKCPVLSKAVVNIFFSKQVGVKVWHDSQYIQAREPGPPPFLPLQYLTNHVAWFEITIKGLSVWATIGVGKVGCLLLSKLRNITDFDSCIEIKLGSLDILTFVSIDYSAALASRSAFHLHNA